MQELIDAMQLIGEQLTPEIMSVLVTAIGIFVVVMALYFIGMLTMAMASTEQGKTAKMVWSMVDDALYNAAMVMLWHGYEDTKAQEMADEYEELYGKKIDPRLAYSIKQAEAYIELHAPFDFNFWEVYHRAESMYLNRVKK